MECLWYLEEALKEEWRKQSRGWKIAGYGDSIMSKDDDEEREWISFNERLYRKIVVLQVASLGKGYGWGQCFFFRQILEN